MSHLRRRWPLQRRMPVLGHQGDAWAGLEGRGEEGVFGRPDWSSSTLLAS